MTNVSFTYSGPRGWKAIIIPLFVLFCGIVMFVINTSNQKKASNWIYVDATITEIIEHPSTSASGQSSIDYEVLVEFTAIDEVHKGEIYNGRLNGYSSGMVKGKKVGISYNPENPNEFVWNDPHDNKILNGFAYGFTIAGAVGSVGFVVGKILIDRKKKNNENKELTEINKGE